MMKMMNKIAIIKQPKFGDTFLIFPRHTGRKFLDDIRRKLIDILYGDKNQIIDSI
jgi:hypothetical protein